MRCLQGPVISGDFDKNGEYGEHGKCSENLADSPYSPLRAFLVILGAGKARENPRSII